MTDSLTVVFPLFPQVTQLDFTGPFEVFARLPNTRCVLASVAGGSIEADGGISFTNVLPLASIERASLLCVPGGFGVIPTMEDHAYLTQLRRLAATATYVTSVCTGSLLLAAAGLLQGKRAGCHWAWRDLLPQLGAIPDAGRVVRDGNTITGGGVTAGIDMALTVVAEIAGPEFAQGVQLALEYAPQPPFDAGRPETAGAAIIARVAQRMDRFAAQRHEAVSRAATAMSKWNSTL